MQKDFRNFAVNHLGINSNTLDGYARHIDRQGAVFTSTSPSADYMNPYILEERQLNVTQMDVFSRLMMDRIIFLGTQVSDTSANIIQAQLLYLDSIDPDKDISIYINSPGGSVYAGLGIYDTMQYISSDVSTICTGMAASMAAVLLVAGEKGKRFALPHSRVMIRAAVGGGRGRAGGVGLT
ncbi:MAG: ATP-dependent Clp protease proteolytic subunit, partial [Muribaculaceae bacterium]|nr:ATP-dependent Clp protease proteolytic subunit [Muribaculaceae bacterium]